MTCGGMNYLSPKHLPSESDFSDTPTDSDGLCSFYKVDPTTVAREVSTLTPLYRQLHNAHALVSVADLVLKDATNDMTQTT